MHIMLTNWTIAYDSRYLDEFYISINKYPDMEIEDLYVDYAGIRPKPFAANEQPKDFIIKNEISQLGFPI